METIIDLGYQRILNILNKIDTRKDKFNEGNS